MKLLTVTCMNVALLAPVVAAEMKLKIESLPPAVQAAVKEYTRDAKLVGLSAEKENGKTVYELETKRTDGKTVDMLIDSGGAVVETEEEVDLNSIPEAARAAIRQKAAAGSVQKVEKLTKGSAVSYEAAVKTKSGKSTEVGVNADGTPHKG